MSATAPTLRDFQFLFQLVDAGLIKASFTFRDMRALLSSFGVLTPDVDLALKTVEANPGLIDIGVQTLRDALSKYPLDTPLTDIFGGSTGGGGGTPTPITITPQQALDGYKALVGIAETSSKALSQFLTTPAGQQVTNGLYAFAQSYAKLLADYNAKTITAASFVNSAVDLSLGTSALAIAESQFFTGRAPSKDGLAFIIDSPNNPRDLTDLVNQLLSTENRYIANAVDFANGAGTEAFRSAYANISFADAVAKMYDAIIGNAKAVAAGVNVSAAVAYVTGQQAYFRAYGLDDLGTKAAAAGFLISKGLESHIGGYNDAIHSYLAKVFDGSAGYGGSILSTSAPSDPDGAALSAPAGGDVAVVGAPAELHDAFA